MSWNYRILRKSDENLYLYYIAEVYYDKKGIIKGWCDRKDILEWDDLRDLNVTIRLLQDVIGKPILEEKDSTLIEITIKQKEENKNGKID